MKITVIDFLELVKEERFDIYVNGIQVGEGVEYYAARQKYYNSELPPWIDRAMSCNVIKVDFKCRRVFAERLENELGDAFLRENNCVTTIIDELVKEMTEDKV